MADKKKQVLAWGDRKKLPAKRVGYNQRMTIPVPRNESEPHRPTDVTIHLRTGEYSDGTLGEIFVDISNNREQTTRALMNLFATSVSLCLQHGATLDELCGHFIGTAFPPSGMLQSHDDLKMCQSIVDAIFKDLAINYLDRLELSHVRKPAE